jgi:hypothetical protein
MARYGYNRYGTFKYGEISAASVYYNSEIVAIPTDFNMVSVSWKPVLTDPADGAMTHWKLVRSDAGIPDNPERGTTLIGGVYSQFTNLYIDSAYLGSIETSYSIWVFNGSKWIFSGGAYAHKVAETDLLQQVSRWWPKAWLNSVEGIGDATGENNPDSLVTMLGAFTFIYDKLRVEAYLLGLQNNPSFVQSSLLESKVTDLGFTVEPALGDQYHRTLAATGHIINSYKGTTTGVSTYVTALTHWADDVIVGHNLMLDYDDSSFEESIGRWSAGSGTFVSTTYVDESLATPVSVLYDRVFQPRKVAFGKLSTSSSSPVTLLLPSTSQSPILYGVPISELTRYVFSGQVTQLQSGVSADVKTKIHWYNGTGALISSTSYGTTVTTAEGSWLEFVSPSDSGRTGIMSPRNSVYAALEIVIDPSSATAASFGLDMLQFAEANKSLEFQDARRINVYVQGERTNYLLNSSFEYGTSSWSSLNGDLSLDTTKTSALVHGDAAALLTASTTSAAIISDWFPIIPGTEYTFGSYVVGSSAQDAVARIEFSSQLTLENQVDILTDEDGDYYPEDPYFIDSDPVELETDEGVQISVSALAPPYSKDAGMPLAKVSLYFPNSSSGDQFWIDGCIVERGLTNSRYFSGDGGVVPDSPVLDTYYAPNDCRWEITTKYNYVPNSSFQDNTTGWTAAAGTTLTRVATDSTYVPLFGGYFGKATYTTTGSVSTTAYLPNTALGGEDIVISAYVRSTTGTYTLNSKTFTVPASGENLWTRISKVEQLVAGQTTVPLTITATGGTKFHIDGVQVQYGLTPSSFVDKGDTSTIELVNPLTTSKNMWAVISENAGASLGLYLHNYRTKLSRLEATLPSYLPKGSSWSILPGLYGLTYQDLTESLIPSSSFELSLGSWQGTNATLTRVVTQGSLSDDTATQGMAYCHAVSVNGTATFGLSTDEIFLAPNAGYYASVALRSTTALGTYTLKVDFYDSSGAVVNVYSYPDGVFSAASQRVIDEVLVSGTDVTTTGGRANTATISVANRWTYLAKSFPSNTIAGAAYAILTVSYTSATYTAAQSFDIDRVVFRQ